MPDLPATAVATPANTAPVAPKPAAQTATPPAASGTTTGTAAPEVFWEGTVDGKPVRYTKAQADRLMSKAGFADKVISQTKEQAKEWQKKLDEYREREAIWDDDEKLEAELAKRGKLDKLARRRLEKHVAEQEMSPEQRAIAERDAKIATMEKEKADREEKDKQSRVSARAQQLAKQMEDTLADSVTRAGLKPSPDILAALNDVMSEWAQIGMLDPTQPFSAATADAVVDAANAKIQDSRRDFTQRVAKGLDGQALEEFLGKDVIDKAIAHRIAVRRNGGRPAAPTQQPLAQRKPDEGPAYKSPQQLREEREARMQR